MPLISYSLSFGFFSWEYFHKKNIWQKTFSLFAIGWAIINSITWGFPSLHYDFTPLFINLIVVYLFLESYLNNSEFSLFHMIILATSSFMIKPMGAMTIIFLFIFTFMLIQAKKISLRQSILVWLIPLLCFFVNSTILKIIPLGMFTILLLATFYLNMTGKRGPLNLLSIGIHLPGPIQLAPIIENNQVILKIWKPIQLNKCIPNNPNFICPQNVDLYKELSDCSNSPLPCTSYFNDNIRLRDGKKIENGFRLKE